MDSGAVHKQNGCADVFRGFRLPVRQRHGGRRLVCEEVAPEDYDSVRALCILEFRVLAGYGASRHCGRFRWRRIRRPGERGRNDVRKVGFAGFKSPVFSSPGSVVVCSGSVGLLHCQPHVQCCLQK